ncbi:MAG: YicC family protein [Clostridiales bacterium]|nr:YicC family protein [Clostridiales bacterium]
MLNSMTGYGRGEVLLHQHAIVVELRSVNNRYLDCSVRLPRVYACAEDAVQSEVKAAVSRGKVEVNVTVDASGSDAVSVTLNQPVAAGYLKALREMGETFGLRDDVSVSLLSRLPDVFRVERAPENLEQLTEDIRQVTRMALTDFNAMRAREGEKLAEDLLGRLDTLEGYTCQVEARSPETVTAYRERLTVKLREVLEDRQIDDARILTEAAIFADKVAVAEETVRLHSHINQFRGMIRQGGVIGRKLDFLIQEMNRETNTTGSKCNDLQLSTIVVDMKAELEKLREQVQNVE